MAGRFSVEAVFTAVDRMTAPVRRMQSNVRAMQSNVNRGFRRIDDSVTRTTSGIYGLATAATAAATTVGYSAMRVVNAGADFEQSLVRAASKFPEQIRKGTESFRELERAALSVGSATEFSSGEAAQALDFLAMAGFNAQQSIAALPGVVDLATASGQSLASATDMASDALGAFNLMSKDTAKLTGNLARVNDVMARTTTSSNTSMSQLFQTLKKGGPTATSAGASLETVSAMAGLMANAGIKAELAGTAVQNMFLNLISPSTKAAAMMKEIGLETKDASGNLLDMPRIVDNFTRATQSMTKAQRTATVETIFGREGLAGMIAVISAGGDGLEEYRARLEGATGASKAMADMQRDTVKGSMASLGSVIDSVSLKIFGMNKGPLKETIDSTTEWVRKNGDLIAQNVSKYVAEFFEAFDINAIVDFLRTVAQVLTILAALKIAVIAGRAAMFAFNAVVLVTNTTLWAARLAMVAYAAVVSALPTALALARSAFLAFTIALATNPIGAIITAIGLLIAAGIALYQNWDVVSKWFSDFFDGLAEYAPAATEAFKHIVGAIVNPIGTIKKQWDWVKNYFAGVFDYISDKVSSVVGLAAKVGKFVGLIDDDEDEDSATSARASAAPESQVITSGDRAAAAVTRSIESRETSELTIRDETGRAEMTSASNARRARINVIQSGD